jgi:hypothetical protein
MMQIVLIGIGAGAAAALLFASVASGSLLSIFLFYLAPLPILIAALGWSHWAAAIATIGAAVVLSAFFGSVFFLAFMAGAGLPAWWLGYLTMLARPAAAGSQNPQEWYPPGRLVLWAAVLAGLIVIVAIVNFGADLESFRSGLHGALERIVRIQSSPPPTRDGAVPGASNALLDFLVVAIPPAAAVLATITNMLNLWLAGRIVKFSGILHRPWPDLSAMEFPRSVTALFAVAIGLSFFGGLFGVIAGVLAASLFMAYGILGFAVLHTVTRGMDSRAFVLGGVYAAVLVFGWPVLALCLLGLAETTFDLRQRAARKRGPPART